MIANRAQKPPAPRKFKKASPTDIDIPRLCKAITHAGLALRRPRDLRREAVRQYVGAGWAEEGAERDVPVNLLATYISIISRTLVPEEPRVMLSTFDRASVPTVARMEDWANKQIVKQELDKTIERIVIDALFGIGIGKVALATTADASILGYNLPAGYPYLRSIDLDDAVWDFHARDFREVGFFGHRLRVHKDAAIERFGKEAKDLAVSTDKPFSPEGVERIVRLGLGYQGGDSEEYDDFVDLWEIYVPRARKILTLCSDDGGNPNQNEDPLGEQEWIGPDCGPYHVLGYGVVPGNIMPKAPIQDLVPLHKAINDVYRKLLRQSARLKEMVFVQGGADADGNRVMNANDGDILRVDNPDKLKVVSMGGPNPTLQAFSIKLKEDFSWLAGNLDSLGGLSPQAKTATQDKMLEANSSGHVAAMQKATTSFTSGLFNSLCWYWWYHPALDMKTKVSVKGVPDVWSQSNVTPQDRQKTKWDDLEVAVDPYSFQHQTPEARLTAMNNVVQQVVMPMAQLLQQQGITFDMHAYLSKMGKYLANPDIGELMTIQEPPADQGSGGGGGGDQPGMPANTTRTNIRENRSEVTPLGKNKAEMQALLGTNPGGNPNSGQPQMR